ncbi:MAG: hypothetical protein LBV26_07645 [Bacteroidales bacterium]|nr:hypothetical protein [Bacteroidales bacterium]
MQYVISNAISGIVIAKAKPEAIQKSVLYGLLHCVRNDEQGIEVLSSEEV